MLLHILYRIALQVKRRHAATPLLAKDSKELERALLSLGIDASWVKRSEMLNTWTDLAGPCAVYVEEFTRE